MRINFVCKSALVAATLCLAPAALPASAKANQPGLRGAVDKGGSSSDTGLLLQRIQTSALNVKNNSDQLQALLRDSYLSDWRSDGYLLNDIRDDVNNMNKLFSRLRADGGKTAPWEEKVIDRAASTGVNLADTTEDAIGTLNRIQSNVYTSDLGGLANDIYKQASLIDQAVGNLQKYSEARHEVRQLRQVLGLTRSS